MERLHKHLVKITFLLTLIFQSCDKEPPVKCDEAFRKNYSGLKNVVIIEGNPPEARYLISERDSLIFPIYNTPQFKLIHEESNVFKDTTKFNLIDFLHGTDFMTPQYSVPYGCTQFVTKEIIESTYQSDNGVTSNIKIRLVGGGSNDGHMELTIDSTRFGCITFFYGNPSINDLQLSTFQSGGKTYYNIYRAIGNNVITGKIEQDTLYYHHEEGIIQISLDNETKYIKPN